MSSGLREVLSLVEVNTTPAGGSDQQHNGSIRAYCAGSLLVSVAGSAIASISGTSPAPTARQTWITASTGNSTTSKSRQQRQLCLPGLDDGFDYTITPS